MRGRRCWGRILKVEPPRPEVVDGLQLGDERTRCPGRLQGRRGDFPCWGGHHAFTLWALPFHPGEQPSRGMVGSHRLVQAQLYDELCFFSVPQNHQTQNTSSEEVSTWQKWAWKQHMLGWVIRSQWNEDGLRSLGQRTGCAHTVGRTLWHGGSWLCSGEMLPCGDTGCEQGL